MNIFQLNGLKMARVVVEPTPHDDRHYNDTEIKMSDSNSPLPFKISAHCIISKLLLVLHDTA